jgi:multicomponent Na+:H+ antiporter subunit E
MGEHVVTKPFARLIRRLPLAAWLTLVWVMLWGTFDLGTLMFGVVIALLITTMFPLPPITTNIVVRPLRFGQLAAYLVWDLFVSALRVSWQAVRYGRHAKAGIVAVRTMTDSDHLTAMVASALSLAPGKNVMQIDRSNRICYVYVLGMREGDIASIRRDFLAMEARVVRAVGSRAEVAVVDAYRMREG